MVVLKTTVEAFVLYHFICSRNVVRENRELKEQTIGEMPYLG